MRELRDVFAPAKGVRVESLTTADGDPVRSEAHVRFKFFPAEFSGGIGALRAFSGPFAQVKFCPTGGIDAAKAPGYLALSNVITVGGSWMVPGEAIASRDWGAIGRLAKACTQLRA